MSKRNIVDLQNPKNIALKKYFYEFLKENYLEFDDLISRLAHHLVTDKDMTTFANLINKIYEIGYYRAASDYKEQLDKLGIKANIIIKKNKADNQK